MSRRSLGDQVDKDALDTLTRRAPKRARSWESEQRGRGVVVTYRGIPSELQARIKEIAGEHGVKVGELARRFLEHAIDAYAAGDLVLEPVEVTRKATLYPDE